MKLLLELVFLFFSNVALAAEPAYTCDPARACREVPGPSFDIGRGAMLTLPPGWRIFSYPTAPIPVMAGLREFRAVKNGMVIAISPMPNIEERVVAESQLCGFVRGAADKYVRLSNEQTITMASMTHGDIVGCYVSFTAANEGEKPFVVLPNRHHASVTTFSISYKFIIFSISAASEQLPDEDFAAAVKSIQQIY